MRNRPIVTYMDFRGGLNVDSSPKNLADNELMLANNAVLSEMGSASKRKGTVPFNSVSYGEQVERIIAWPRNDGSEVLLAIMGTTLYKIAEDGTRTSVQALQASDIGYFYLQDKFYFTDGTEYYVYDGANVKKARPEIVLTGVTGSFSIGETITGGTSSATATVDVIDGNNLGVSNVSGTFQDGETVTGGTSSASGTIDNMDAGVNETNDLEPIKRCKYFMYNPKNYRIFAAGDTNDRAALFYSEPNDPTYFVETSKLYPTTADGPIYGLEVYANGTLVSYKNSNWAWKGVDPATDAEWEKLPVTHGTLSHRSIELTPNSLTFLGSGGIYSLSPSLMNYNIILLTGDELVRNRAKNKVTSIIRSITDFDKTCAVYDRENNMYLLAYCDDDSLTRNNKILALNWDLQAFTVFTGLQVNDFCQRANGDILIASNNYILKMNTGNKDWDVEAHDYKAIDFEVHTKYWHLSSYVYKKIFWRSIIFSRQYEAEVSSLTSLTIVTDYETKTFENISLEESFVWGDEWGIIWGWRNFIDTEVRLGGIKGKTAQARFKNTELDEPVSIYGIAFEFDFMDAEGVKLDG